MLGTNDFLWTTALASTRRERGKPRGDCIGAKLLVVYGSHWAEQTGIRLADHVAAGLTTRGAEAMLIDARAVGLPRARSPSGR